VINSGACLVDVGFLLGETQVLYDLVLDVHKEALLEYLVNYDVLKGICSMILFG
jgi:hypothetical protein